MATNALGGTLGAPPHGVGYLMGLKGRTTPTNGCEPSTMERSSSAIEVLSNLISIVENYVFVFELNSTQLLTLCTYFNSP